MKRNYLAPSFQIIEMITEDVVTASLGVEGYDDSNNDYFISWSE